MSVTQRGDTVPKPFLLSELELHLIVDHEVRASLIAATHESHPDRAKTVAEISHELMHQGEVGHTHDDDDDGNVSTRAS